MIKNPKQTKKVKKPKTAQQNKKSKALQKAWKDLEKVLDAHDNPAHPDYIPTTDNSIDGERASLEEAENVSGECQYDVTCPNCETFFEAYESDCGKPPFDVECPACGTLCAVN